MSSRSPSAPVRTYSRKSASPASNSYSGRDTTPQASPTSQEQSSNSTGGSPCVLGKRPSPSALRNNAFRSPKRKSPSALAQRKRELAAALNKPVNDTFGFPSEPDPKPGAGQFKAPPPRAPPPKFHEDGVGQSGAQTQRKHLSFGRADATTASLRGSANRAIFSEGRMLPPVRGNRWLAMSASQQHKRRQRASAATLPSATLHEAQESGEMIAQLDDVNYALDGLGASSDLRVLRSNALSLAELCSVKSQRCLFASQGLTRVLLERLLALPVRDDSLLAEIAGTVLQFVAQEEAYSKMLAEMHGQCIHFVLGLLESPDVTAQDLDSSERTVRDAQDRLQALYTKKGAKSTMTTLGDRKGRTRRKGANAVVAHSLRTSTMLALYALTSICGSAAVLCEEDVDTSSAALLIGTKRSAKAYSRTTDDPVRELLGQTRAGTASSGTNFKAVIRSSGLLEAIASTAACAICDLLRNLSYIERSDSDILAALVDEDKAVRTELELKSTRDAAHGDESGDPFAFGADQGCPGNECKGGFQGDSELDEDGLPVAQLRREMLERIEASQHQLLCACQVMESAAYLSRLNQAFLLRVTVAMSLPEDCRNSVRAPEGHMPLVEALLHAVTVLSKQSLADASRKCMQTTGASGHEARQRPPLSKDDGLDERVRILTIECLVACLNVLTNLSNENDVGCKRILDYEGLSCLHSVLVPHAMLTVGQMEERSKACQADQGPEDVMSVVKDLVVDSRILANCISLLVNLVENNPPTCAELGSMAAESYGGIEGHSMSSVAFLTRLFASFIPQLEHEATEEESEEQLEAISIGVPSAILLGCFARDSRHHREVVKHSLPDGNVEPLQRMVKRARQWYESAGNLAGEGLVTMQELQTVLEEMAAL